MREPLDIYLVSAQHEVRAGFIKVTTKEAKEHDNYIN